MSPVWKLRLYYGGILAVVWGTMALAPVLIFLVVPLLMAVTRWSVAAWVAKSIVADTQAYEKGLWRDPKEKLFRRREKRQQLRSLRRTYWGS